MSTDSRVQFCNVGTLAIINVGNLGNLVPVAGSTLFLTAALLFVWSFLNSAAFDRGFDTAHSLVLELNRTAFGYDQAHSQRFFDALVEYLREVPGIEHAALADRAPFSVGFPRNAAAMAACALPAMRAMRADPVVALRQE